MTPSTLGDFVASIDRFIDKMDGRLDELVMNVGFVLAENVIVGGQYSPGTPVDTGFARESWWVDFELTGSPPGPQAMASGQAALDQATLRLLDVKCGGIVYLLNNAAYIKALEYGHSQQAPAGMVRLAAASGQRIVDQVAKQMTAGGK